MLNTIELTNDDLLAIIDKENNLNTLNIFFRNDEEYMINGKLTNHLCTYIDIDDNELIRILKLYNINRTNE